MKNYNVFQMEKLTFKGDNINPVMLWSDFNILFLMRNRHNLNECDLYITQNK